MKITNGLISGMVMPLGGDSRSDQHFSGIGETDGVVTAIFQGERFACGNCRDGEISGSLRGIPPGGPYEIVLELNGSKVNFSEMYCGMLWVLAGQSNMKGYGRLASAFQQRSPMVRVWSMDDRWRVAAEPLIQPKTARTNVHRKLCGITEAVPYEQYTEPYGKGAGPGTAFGHKMLSLTKMPQGLIACAHGGTSMKQWSPGLLRHGDSSLYGAMLGRVKHLGGRVTGVLWSQGCGDASNPEYRYYQRRMDRFINALRRDLGDGGLPIVMAQLCRLAEFPDPGLDRQWSAIREAQRSMVERHERLAVIPTVDLELDDTIHLSGAAQTEQGNRFADAAFSLLYPRDSSALPLLQLHHCQVIRHPEIGEKWVVVKYRNVSGRLTAPCRPEGFLFNTERQVSPFRTELCGDNVVLHLPLSFPSESLSYGWGMNPVCNIYDEAGRPLPAFGPCSLEH